MSSIFLFIKESMTVKGLIKKLSKKIIKWLSKHDNKNFENFSKIKRWSIEFCFCSEKDKLPTIKIIEQYDHHLWELKTIWNKRTFVEI